jgi:hypothetical protein
MVEEQKPKDSALEKKGKKGVKDGGTHAGRA